MTTTTPVAFFYTNPEVLQFAKHQKLRFNPVGTAGFAAQQTVVPIVLAEFSLACMEYPIVFAKADASDDSETQWIALAVTGLQPGRNAFVNSQGQWTGRYVPASIRRYPFVLAKTGGEDYSVAADLDAPHFQKSGEAIFNSDGSPSELMKNVLPLLQDFQAQAQVTSQLISRLVEAQLLEETSVNLQLPNADPQPIGKIWMVNEQKLLAAADDLLLSLTKSGELGFIYAHLLSLRNLSNLMELANAEVNTTGRSVRKSSAKNAPGKKPTPPAKTISKTAASAKKQPPAAKKKATPTKSSRAAKPTAKKGR